MIFSIAHVYRTLLRVGRVVLIISLVLTIPSIQFAQGAEFKALDESALRSLGKQLTAMEKLTPQLSAHLRNVRTSMKFDVRQIHDIELSIEKTQSDIERLIVMHNTDRVNPVRARFLVDSLRRKAATLDQGLSHVTRRLEKKYGGSGRGEGNRAAYSEEDSQLLSLLQEYDRLVNQGLQLISGETR